MIHQFLRITWNITTKKKQLIKVKMKKDDLQPRKWNRFAWLIN